LRDRFSGVVLHNGRFIASRNIQGNEMRIRPIFAWYDFWIGLYWDRKARRLYVFPLPMIGMVLDFGASK
jgi:hypothetical protein